MSSWAKIAFDTESFDTQGDYDTTSYQFAAPSAGIYRVNGRIVTSSNVVLAIYINGTEHLRSANTVTYKTIDTMIQLAASDVIEIYVYNPSPFASVTLGLLSGSYFEVEQID